MIVDLQTIRPTLPDELQVVVPSVNADHAVG